MSALKKTILITVSILILIILYYFIFVLDLRLLSERQYQTSSIQKKVEYEECTKEQSKNIHKIDGYSIQFFDFLELPAKISLPSFVSWSSSISITICLNFIATVNFSILNLLFFLPYNP